MPIFVSIQFKMLLLSSFGSFLNSWLTLVKFINFRGDPQPPITYKATFFICKEAALKVQMSVCICVCLSVSNVQFNSGYTGLYRSIYWQMILLVLSGTGDSHTIVYLMTGKFFVCERIFKKEDCCMHEIYISVNKHMARDHSLLGVPNIGIKPGSI